MSFVNDEKAKRLMIAIQAAQQVKDLGGTFLKINGNMSEKITTVKAVAIACSINYKTLCNHLIEGRLKKHSFGAGHDHFWGKQLKN